MLGFNPLSSSPLGSVVRSPVTIGLAPNPSTATGTGFGAIIRAKKLLPFSVLASTTNSGTIVRARAIAPFGGTSFGTGAATLTRIRPLFGSPATAATTQSGSFGRRLVLTGSGSAAATSSTPVIKAARQIGAGSGSAAGTASSPPLTRSRRLSPISGSGATTQAGTDAGVRVLRPNAVLALSSSSGALRALRSITAGAGTALTTQSAFLSKFKVGILSGTGFSSTSQTGVIASRHSLNGAASASGAGAAATGNPAVRRLLVATAAAASAQAAPTLVRTRSLAGSATAVSSQGGAVSGTRVLRGAATANASSIGFLTFIGNLSGTASAVSSQSGILSSDAIPPLEPMDGRIVYLKYPRRGTRAYREAKTPRQHAWYTVDFGEVIFGATTVTSTYDGGAQVEAPLVAENVQPRGNLVWFRLKDGTDGTLWRLEVSAETASGYVVTEVLVPVEMHS